MGFLGSIIGGGLGFIVGGPAGAAIGVSLGLIAGEAIDDFGPDSSVEKRTTKSGFSYSAEINGIHIQA
ncbi:hypothetical protein KAI87_12640, partial [Myxococcota bacterium]|nr:hypothetical protein [Myxococcota bacterium]